MQRGQLIWTVLISLVASAWGAAVIVHAARGDWVKAVYGLVVLSLMAASALDALKRLRAGEPFEFPWQRAKRSGAK